MRKAIRLVVTVEIEAEDEPAHDFYASTSRAVRDIIKAGRARHPELKVKVKGVKEAGDDGEDDEDLLAEDGDTPR